MNWMVFASSIPGPVDLGTLSWVSVGALAVVLAPLWLVARPFLASGATKTERRQLLVINGATKVNRQAA